jgi:hypothetical protein
VAQCKNCGEVLIVVINSGNPYKLRVIIPAMRDPEPEEYPEDVRQNFAEAVKALSVGLYKASVM